MDRIPILRIKDVLLVSIQVDIHDELVSRLQEDVAQEIASQGARGVIVDVSAVDVIDTYLGRMLGLLARIGKLLSAEVVLVGMRPAVAITLVELGMTLDAIKTALDIDRALDILNQGAGDGI